MEIEDFVTEFTVSVFDLIEGDEISTPVIDEVVRSIVDMFKQGVINFECEYEMIGELKDRMKMMGKNCDSTVVFR